MRLDLPPLFSSLADAAAFLYLLCLCVKASMVVFGGSGASNIDLSSGTNI